MTRPLPPSGPHLPGRRTSRLVTALVAVAVSSTACGPAADAAPPAPDSTTFEIAGQRAVLLEPEQPNGRLVVYLHGASGGADDVLAQGDRARGDLAAGLAAAGYAVAASDAHGAAWGNPASVADYQALTAEARRRSGATSVYLLAESMGGLAAVQLTAPGALDGLRALAGIYPVCDLSSVRAGFAASVDAAYGGDADAAVAALSPVRPDPSVPLQIWASADDTVVPAAQNAEVCVAEALAAGGSARLVRTVGDHGDPSDFALDDLLEFYDSAP